MRLELELAGESVQFLSVNMPSGLETQASLAEKCSFPLFQDLEEVDVWGLMNGKKDDFYIYDAQGNLARYYSWGTEPALNLSTDEGYAVLKDAVLEVIAGVSNDTQTADAFARGVSADAGPADAVGGIGDLGPSPEAEPPSPEDSPEAG